VSHIEGGAGQSYRGLVADKDTKVSIQMVKSSHVPFDDNPIESNKFILQWLDSIVA